MPRSTVQEMLAQQRGFLKSSLQAYKDGNDAESLRIATTLRVLIHDTTKSHALLKQVDPNYLNLTILDRPDFSSGRKILVLYDIGVSRSGDGTGTVDLNVTLNGQALQLTRSSVGMDRALRHAPGRMHWLIHGRRRGAVLVRAGVRRRGLIHSTH